MKQIAIFDSTLRDGAQAESISFSVSDKLKIVSTLDELGVSYIEAGNPGSNPKDLEFFKEVKKLHLKAAKLTAFGSTRRRNMKVQEDSNVMSLLEADTPAVAIFGKTWDFHVTEIIKTTLEENLNMIYDTIKFFKDNGKEVIFDAEHFFDGYKNNKEYALSALKKAEEAGADCIALCETNGGAFPDEVYEIVKTVVGHVDVQIGIHTHDDTGMGVANSIMAVLAGATHVQGTLVGFGERCGNANLSTIIPNLQVKRDYQCIPEENMTRLTSLSRRVAEIANVSLRDNMPYVGKSAFAHKAGMHIDGVTKASTSFEHVPPHSVGNERRFLMSEVAGRSTIIEKIQRIAPQITKDDEVTQQIINRIKDLEHQGYQFEGADGTFELLVRKALGKYKPFFDLEEFKIIGEEPRRSKGVSSSAIIKVRVGSEVEMTAAEGEGPVNALDTALRKALEVFYPDLKEVHLTDYKVRVLDTKSATAAKVRVLLESTDGEDYWSTVGVSTDIIEASWIALVDSIEYKLIKDIEKRFKAYM
ncbi:citramalate synthase [Cellulosilyticum sp. I15G10I2]|uniref:citramalate synthase n=1 Tax=Cellulosilyticum sp. I15G10I2 TaxID=1892843 RepID=UPI00085CA594|nr:citramalate synthase [Cellulosilyticum sp. I15G10I2]